MMNPAMIAMTNPARMFRSAIFQPNRPNSIKMVISLMVHVVNE